MDTALMEAFARQLGPIINKQNAMQYGTGASLHGFPGMVSQYGYGEKHDPTSISPATSGYMHGPGGLLTWPGVDQTVFNAMMSPMSILGQIPAMPSLNTDPTYFTLTGVGADTGDEPDGVCDDAPQGGLIHGCLTHSVFGRYERATAQLEINRLGQRVDRADPLDLRLVGNPAFNGLGMWAGPAGSGGTTTPPGDLFTNEVASRFWSRNISFYRLLAQQLWTGNPLNNSAGGGYKEITGLQLLVNTGYKDAVTGASCDNMDSYIANFAYGRIDGESSAIVGAFTNVMHQLRFRATRSGMNPVRWVIAMRHELFYELTSIWPCSYLSYRCALAPGFAGETNMRANIDAVAARQMVDEMRQGMYLMIDGERVEVVTDDGIPELSGNDSGGNFPAGCFSSDVYFLPMSVVGGRSVLYLDYFQFTNPSIEDAMGRMILGQIEGAFITWPRQKNLCVEWQSKIEPRLVLRTPQLAARLQNVVYCPIDHTPDVFPDRPYYELEGVTSRPGPSYYELWNS